MKLPEMNFRCGMETIFIFYQTVVLNLRMNLWRYAVSTKKYEQLTNFKDYDIHFPSAGPDDIVFEQGGKLYLFSFASQQAKVVPVNVVTDKAALKTKISCCRQVCTAC